MELKVYIILLNWNGWFDTIECLESIYRCNHKNYNVILCDNDSTDNSVEHVKAWADGRLSCFVPEDNPLRSYSFPPVCKPISYLEVSDNYLASGEFCVDDLPELIIIKNGTNMGFAAGNNVGIQFALARNDFSYVWVLNNDTVIATDSLTKLLEKSESCRNPGICGSTLVYYRNTNIVQALGGAFYNKWLAVPKHIGEGLLCEDVNTVNIQDEDIDFIVGASMLVSKQFLIDVGLMSEDYFLYYEEVDWAMRKKGYALAYSPKSIVYHKDGSSIGTNIDPNKKSCTADYFAIKNRIVFTRKFFPLLLPVVYLGVVLSLCLRIKRLQWGRAKMIFCVLFGCNNVNFGRVT